MVGKVTPDTMMSASRIPALLGLSRYRTRNDELQLSIDAIRGVEREEKHIEAADWGSRLEPIILREAALRLQLRALELDHPIARYHSDLPLCCSLDGTADGGGQVITTDPEVGIYVVGQDSITIDGTGVLEAKLTSHWPEDVPNLERGPLQLQAQMDIIQAKWGAVCVLYQGTELRVFLFAPHPLTVSSISHAVLDFERRLQAFRDTGAADWYPPADQADVDRMHPVAVDQRIALPATAEQLIEDVRKAQQEIEDWHTKKNSAETALKAMLGSFTEGTVGKHLVRWPMRHYKAVPASTKQIPAKEAYSVRQSTLAIKELKNG